jgi:hypothetical protein
MQQVSVFVAECLCGRNFETPNRYYICPHCNRHIRLEWGRDPESSRDLEKESALHSSVEVTA